MRTNEETGMRLFSAFLTLLPKLLSFRPGSQREQGASRGCWRAAGFRPLECGAVETRRCAAGRGSPEQLADLLLHPGPSSGRRDDEWLKEPMDSNVGRGNQSKHGEDRQYLNPLKGRSAQGCWTVFCLVNRFHFLMAVFVRGKQSCRLESILLPPLPHLL